MTAMSRRALPPPLFDRWSWQLAGQLPEPPVRDVLSRGGPRAATPANRGGDEAHLPRRPGGEQVPRARVGRAGDARDLGGDHTRQAMPHDREMTAQLTLEPFRIAIPDADMADLKSRLAATRWPEQLPGTPWQRGVPVDYLRQLADYWA